MVGETRQLTATQHTLMEHIDMDRLKTGEINLGVRIRSPARRCLSTAIHRRPSWPSSSTAASSSAQTVAQPPEATSSVAAPLAPSLS